MATMSPLAHALTHRSATNRVNNRVMATTRPAVGGYSPTRVPDLTDPDFVSAQVTPGDLQARQLPPQSPVTTDGRGMTEEQRKKLLEDAESDFRHDRARKGLVAPTFLESRRAVADDPYWVWDSRAGRWRDSRPDDWEDGGRRFERRNLIIGKILESKARVTRNDPDIGVSPETPSPTDVQAAEEARGVLPSYDDEWGGEAQVQQAWQEACIATPCWKIFYDPSAMDDVPTLGPDGSVQRVEKQRVGRIKRELVPWEQWFCPTGNFYRTWDDIAIPHLIHARPVLLSDIQARHAGGWNVQPEPGVSGDANVMASAGGYLQSGLQQGFESPNRWALLKERYEMPTAALEAQGYPDGRVTTWANGYLLDVRNMDDGFPFFPIYFTKLESDPDGMNYVGRLLSGQRSINAVVSKWREHTELPAYLVFAMNQTSFNPNSFNGYGAKFVNYTGGPKPDMIPRPNFPADSVNLLTTELQLFDRISGITPGTDIASMDASGAAFEARMEQDISATKDQTTNLHAAQLWSANRLLRLVAKYKDTPSLIAMSAQPAPQGGQPAPQAGQDPDQAAARTVASFRALNAGGRVRLKLSPESAIPQMPGQQQALTERVFGNLTPDNAPLIAAMLKASDVVGTNPLYEALSDAIRQMQASQPDPAAQAQAMEQQKAQNAAQQAALESHVAQEHAAIDLHAKETLAAQQHGFAMEKMAFERQHPAVSLSASADPKAVVEIERAAGYEGEEPPVPTAAPASKPKASKGK